MSYEGLQLEGAAVNVWPSDRYDITAWGGSTATAVEAPGLFGNDAADLTDADGGVQGNKNIVGSGIAAVNDVVSPLVLVHKTAWSGAGIVGLRYRSAPGDAFYKVDLRDGSITTWNAANTGTDASVTSWGVWWVINFKLTHGTENATYTLYPAIDVDMTPDASDSAAQGTARFVCPSVINPGFDFATSPIPSSLFTSRAATSCTAPFTDIPGLPDEGLFNGFCGQLVVETVSLVPGEIQGFLQLYGDDQNRMDVYMQSGGGMVWRHEANNVTSTVNPTAPVDTHLDFRFSKSPDTGLRVWLNSVKVEDPALTDPFVTGISEIRLARNNTSTNVAEGIYKAFRLIPADLDEATIMSWPSYDGTVSYGGEPVTYQQKVISYGN